MVLSEDETLYAFQFRDHLNTGGDTPDDAELDPVRAELIRETLLRAQRDALRRNWPRSRRRKQSS